MKEAIDIYIKLLIAIISFIAPLLIHLLSVFSDGVAVKTKRAAEFKSQHEGILTQIVNKGGDNMHQQIRKTTDNFDSWETYNAEKIDLLQPKKQIKRIFPTFFYSLLFVLGNRLLCDIEIYTAAIRLHRSFIVITPLLFIASVYFAIKGVVRLYDIAVAIIEVKAEIAEYNAVEKQSKGNLISPPENDEEEENEEK